jgi:hypothetical protein
MSTHSSENWPKAGHQHLVAGVERIGDGAFPGTRAGTREHEHTAFGRLVDALEAFKKRLRQFTEVRCTHVLHGHVHGLANGFWNIGRSGDEEMCMTVFHCCVSSKCEAAKEGFRFRQPDR